jgi:carboxymethylenebutenolidase
VGTIGWCFGGGWSLNASIAEPVNATVVYYGRVDRRPDQLGSLEGPVLGHFATRDRWINREMVGAFEKAMDGAGKSYTTYWYEADHAFANPSGGRYDAEDAKLAWERTLAFYRQHL